ncbi:MAG: hypothetical protein Q9181_006200 [Wetmoreana brouardii]
MAEEPQPPIREGLDPTSEDPATTAETTAPADRKAAAALSFLESHGEDTSAQSSKIKNIDQEALAKAISRLELSTGVQELDLSKTKATELLREHEGDAIKAMRAFVTAPV